MCTRHVAASLCDTCARDTCARKFAHVCACESDYGVKHPLRTLCEPIKSSHVIYAIKHHNLFHVRLFMFVFSYM